MGRTHRLWPFPVIYLLFLLVSFIEANPRRTSRPGDGAPPKVLDNVKTHFKVSVREKQFKFVCPVADETDDEDLLFQWIKDGEQVEFDWDERLKVSKNGRELRLKPLKVEDSGRYGCQVTNGFGHHIVNFTLHVFATPPRWLNEAEMEGPANVRIARGGRLELRCPAKGNPLPEVQWVHDNDIIEESTSSAIFMKETVSEQDDGLYRCVVKNEHGFIEADFHVIVSEELETPTEEADQMLTKKTNRHGAGPYIEPVNSTVHRGRTAQFTCRARTAKPSVIKWLKKIDDLAKYKAQHPNATIINANSMNLLVVDSNNVETFSDHEQINRLVFARAQPEHSGEYLCVVTDPVGHFIYGSAHLLVIDSNDFDFLGFPPYFLFLLFVIPIVIVILAIHFLLKYQKSEGPQTKPIQQAQWHQPPPPRMPPPPAPDMRRPLVRDECGSPLPYVHRGKALRDNGNYSCACHSPQLSFPTSGYVSQRGYYRTLEMLRQPAPSLQSSSDY